jgi:hypothetical protein
MIRFQVYDVILNLPLNRPVEEITHLEREAFNPAQNQLEWYQPFMDRENFYGLTIRLHSIQIFRCYGVV